MRCAITTTLIVLQFSFLLCYNSQYTSGIFTDYSAEPIVIEDNNSAIQTAFYETGSKKDGNQSTNSDKINYVSICNHKHCDFGIVFIVSYIPGNDIFRNLFISLKAHQRGPPTLG